MKRAIPLLIALGSLSLAAWANPITWTLTGVSLSGGGSATGTFVYDADTNTFSSIEASVTGSTLGAASFTFLCVSPCLAEAPPTDSNFAFLTQSSSSNLSGTLELEFALTDPMTDAGGTIPVEAVIEATCSDSTCQTFSGDTPENVTGSIVATATPEPSTALLGASALMLLGLGRFRRQRSA